MFQGLRGALLALTEVIESIWIHTVANQIPLERPSEAHSSALNTVL